MLPSSWFDSLSVSVDSSARSGVQSSASVDGSGWNVATGGSSGASGNTSARTAPGESVAGGAILPPWAIPVGLVLVLVGLALAVKKG